MNTITQTYTINAPATKVWQALTDARTAEQWGAAPANVEANEGGTFSYWDGDIHGTFTKLTPYTLIEQDWYGHDDPDQKYRAVFTFKEENGVTKVTLHFSGDIKNEKKDISDWQNYYFDPIKQLLESQQ